MFGRVLLLFALVVGVKSACPNGALEWGTNCYYFNATGSAYTRAEEACIKKGGHLASIHDAFTNDILSQNAPDYFHQTTITDFWIGVNDLTTVNKWQWTDSSTFDFNEWGRGQPVNRTGYNCGAMSLINGLWVAADCFKAKPYVCAVPNGAPQTTTPSKGSTTTKAPVTTTTTGVTVGPGSCPTGWLYFAATQSCFGLLFDSDTDWNSAETRCQSFGAGSHLASIHTADELKFLGDNIPFCHAPWIGLYSTDNGTTWVWNDGTPFDYVNWYPGSPQPGTNQNCGILDFACNDFEDDQFDVYDCTAPWSMVCKIGGGGTGAPPTAPTTTPPTQVSTVSAPTGNCPSGWLYFAATQTCFGLLFDSDTDWNSAETRCQSFGTGSHLASIHTADELKFLGDNIPFCHAPWIGLYSTDNGTTWVWNDGTPFDYVNWYPGSPQPGTNQNCGILDFACNDFEDDQFDVYDCTAPWSMVCRKASGTK